MVPPESITRGECNTSVIEYGSIRSNSSNRSKRFERLKRLERFEPGPLVGSPLDRYTLSISTAKSGSYLPQAVKESAASNRRICHFNRRGTTE
jgi:hypothetical protein